MARCHGDREPIVEFEINSKLATHGSVVEYKNKVVGFSQGERVDLDVTLASSFSQKEGGDLVEVVASTVEQVHVMDSHAHNLMINFYGLLLPLPQAWYFKIEELTYANFYL